MPKQKKDGGLKPEYKVVIVGIGGVGKSSLTKQFFFKRFDPDNAYNPRVEDTYRKQMLVDGQSALIEVLDTAGQEEFSAMREYYMKKGDGFLLVYSVTEKQSFENIMDFYNQILLAKKIDSCPMLLVANKVDLVDAREFTEKQGKELSIKLNISYIETSAKTSLNVESAFIEITRIVQNFREAEARIGKCEKKCGVT